ncbi:FxsA family protein [Halomonas sp. LS-001]
MPLLLLISLFTLLDFVVLFTVGSDIGLLATLLLILVTGVGGLHLIRREGAVTLGRAREKMNAGELPSNELLTGAALIFGGALLMAPGFLSDAIGLACLLPNARKLMFKFATWVGVGKKGLGSTTHNKASHNGASRPNGADGWHSREERTSRRTGETEKDGPLEGDFISGDESRRR